MTGIIDSILQRIDKFLNPLKYETELERQERHRKENMQHQLELAKIKRTRYTEKSGSGSSRVDPFEEELRFLDGSKRGKR